MRHAKQDSFASLNVVIPTSNRAGFHRKMKTLICSGEFLFRPPTFGDVYIYADHLCRLAGLVHKNLPASNSPMNTAISPDHAPFSRGRLSRFQRAVLQLNDSCSIVGMNQTLESELCCPKSSEWQTVHRLQFRCPSVHPCLDIPFKSSYPSG